MTLVTHCVLVLPPRRGDEPGLPAWFAQRAGGLGASSPPPAAAPAKPLGRAQAARGGGGGGGGGGAKGAKGCLGFCQRSAKEWPTKCKWRDKCDACAECGATLL